MKVNDKWAHLVVWATVYKLPIYKIYQTLDFSRKFIESFSFWGELTFHAWKAWYQADLKFIHNLNY